MKKRIVAILLVCMLGLAAYLLWPLAHDAESHDAKYYFDRAWERLPGHDNTPGDPEGAIADFNRAIKLNPKLAAAYAGRAIAKEIMADPGYRVSIFSSRERESESPRRKTLLNEAIADLDRAIELDPKQADYFDRRAWLKHEKGDFSGMVADLARENEVAPSSQLPLRQVGARGDVAARLLGAGLRNYSRAIAQDPAFAWGYYHRGVLKSLANDLDGALIDFRRCAEFPDSQLKDYAAIHIWLVRAQKKETVDASAELSAHFSSRTNDSPPNWEWQIAGFLLDQVSEADFLAAASGPEVERKRSQFSYYKAEKRLLAGDKAKAVDCFREALKTEVRPYAVLMSAEIQLGLLNQ